MAIHVHLAYAGSTTSCLLIILSLFYVLINQSKWWLTETTSCIAVFQCPCVILIKFLFLGLSWTSKVFSKLVWKETLQIPLISFLLDVNFENLIVRLYAFYVLNMYIKFYLNQMLFTIQSKQLFFIFNFRQQKFKI